MKSIEKQTDRAFESILIMQRNPFFLFATKFKGIKLGCPETLETDSEFYVILFDVEMILHALCSAYLITNALRSCKGIGKFFCNLCTEERSSNFHFCRFTPSVGTLNFFLHVTTSKTFYDKLFFLHVRREWQMTFKISFQFSIILYIQFSFGFYFAFRFLNL